MTRNSQDGQDGSVHVLRSTSSYVFTEICVLKAPKVSKNAPRVCVFKVFQSVMEVSMADHEVRRQEQVSELRQHEEQLKYSVSKNVVRNEKWSKIHSNRYEKWSSISVPSSFQDHTRV